LQSGYCNPIGSTKDATYEIVEGDVSKGIKVTYKAQPFTTIINLECDENAGVGKPAHAPSTDYEFYFTWKSSEACLKAPPSDGRIIPGLGIGGLIMVLIIAGFMSYMIIGCFIKYKKYKATGFQMIPNGTFWKNFPFLVKDGIIFTIEGISDLFQRILKRGQYSTI
jgi:hypothetical protein